MEQLNLWGLNEGKPKVDEKASVELPKVELKDDDGRIVVSQQTLETYNESYSADVIGEHSTIRKPFTYRGKLYVVTGGLHVHRKIQEVHAVELVLESMWKGEKWTYSEKSRYVQEGDSVGEGNDRRLSFYEGMVVKRGKVTYVLGKSVYFVDGGGDNGISRKRKAV